MTAEALYCASFYFALQHLGSIQRALFWPFTWDGWMYSLGPPPLQFGVLFVLALLFLLASFVRGGALHRFEALLFFAKEREVKSKLAQLGLRLPVPHDFTFNSDSESVTLVGDFNNWKPQNMDKPKEGSKAWTKRLTLEAGEHQYQFVVDGQYLPDPSCPEWVLTPHGSRNSVIRV
ncbi:MAG: hypothetical protein PHV34_08765 [Verrucomicrobiae bacterium]|nr:hypothetical protein [Verrucomicrobiae bacterium]